ncbi:RNA-directed DNA polymerase, eukaryota, reverse transcriptase zinc-binding domain protein [Tanacetum coccineum]
MEGLHIALRDAMDANLLHGVKLGPSNFHLSHLFYVDDVIIVSEWDHKDIDNIIRVLHVFYMDSGIKININKSNLFGVGVSSEEVAIMAANSGCLSGSFPLTYLGLSIDSNMNRVVNWKAPDTVIKVLERLRASFFWGSTEDNKKIAWVKWSNILASFDKGGLGGINSIHGVEENDLMVVKPTVYGKIVGTYESSLFVRLSLLFLSIIRPILSGRSSFDFVHMLDVIGSVKVSQDSDSSFWHLSNDGNFLVEHMIEYVTKFQRVATGHPERVSRSCGLDTACCKEEPSFPRFVGKIQARILDINASYFLKTGGYFVISIKPNCIDSTSSARTRLPPP